MKIVSLLPSATEIVSALGLVESLVGRSHECDFPRKIRSLPAVTSAAYPEQSSSQETDRTLRDLLSSGLSPFKANPEILRKLDPDVILTQDHCDVCAISLENLRQAAKSYLDNADANIISVSPVTLNEIMGSIQTIGNALGVPDKASALVTELNERLNIIRQTVLGEAKKSVVTLEWISPLMTAGNWVPELIEIAGGDDLIGIPGGHSPWIEFEQVREANPDFLLVMPCGYTIQHAANELDTLTQLEGWQELKAVREEQVYLLDGNQYFNRPGPRMYDSARILAEILHPNLFKPLYKGAGWIPAIQTVTAS